MKRYLCLFLLFLLTGLAIWAAPDQATDDRIYDEVRRKLANDPDVKGGAFQVDVKDGAVTMRGEVRTEKFKQKAERIARKVKGVGQVNNQLTVKTQ
jgi:osmotically-inducible protein OsmY